MNTWELIKERPEIMALIFILSLIPVGIIWIFIWIDECKQSRDREKYLQEEERRHQTRLKELKDYFEASGRKKNIADPKEINKFCDCTELGIIRECQRQECHDCKLGWICPKFHS